MQTIYLDVCCLNRPYDDQTQIRIRLEAEAVRSILELYETGKVTLFNSDFIEFEVSKMSNLDKKFKVEQILLIINNFIDANQEIERRANELVELGFNLLDALHIASAELTGLDIFLTTDDDLLNTYNRHKNTINIRINNPIDWTKEMIL